MGPGVCENVHLYGSACTLPHCTLTNTVTFKSPYCPLCHAIMRNININVYIQRIHTQVLQDTTSVSEFLVSTSVNNSSMFLYEWFGGNNYFLKYRSENTGDNSCKD